MHKFFTVILLLISTVGLAEELRSAYVANLHKVARRLFEIQSSHFSGPIQSYGEFIRSLEDKEVIVLENEKGEIVAYTAVKVRQVPRSGVGKNGYTALISDLYVNADFVRKKYGSDLMQAIVELIDCEYVAIAVRDSNRNGLDFVLSQGFRSGDASDQRLVKSNKSDPAFVYTASVADIDNSSEGSGRLRTGQAIEEVTEKIVSVPVVEFSTEEKKANSPKPKRAKNPGDVSKNSVASSPSNSQTTNPKVKVPEAPADRGLPVQTGVTPKLNPESKNVPVPARVVNTRPMPAPEPPPAQQIQAVRYTPPPKSTAQKIDAFFEAESQGAAAVYLALPSYCWALGSFFAGR